MQDIPTVTSTHSIRETISTIDKYGKGIAVLIDDGGHLLATITDGDVRRALLAGMDLDASVCELVVSKTDTEELAPLTAVLGTERSVLLQLMQEHSVRQLPLIDANGRVADLVTLDELLPGGGRRLEAVIMAGGAGERLRPLTEKLPKPMLTVGDRPLMELLIERLRQAGIRRVNIASHYKAESIVEHFGDGNSFGVELNYVTEDQPLGTAGALGFLPAKETLLVINGDILTEVNFQALLDYHREQKAALTVAVRTYEINVPYGVLKTEGTLVRSLVEKPVIRLFVNAGIYLMEPEARHCIPNGEHFDMTDLIQNLLAANQPVVSFPIHEYWLDIGQHADYLQAQEHMKTRGVGI